MLNFEANDANSIWEKIAHHLKICDGDKVNSRLGENKEILHACLTIHKPKQRWVYDRLPAMNPAFAIAEIVWIIMGRNDSMFLKYWNNQLSRFTGDNEKLYGAYGYRLKKNFSFNQIYRVYNIFKNNPETRQVVLQIWDPQKDLPFKNGTPRDQDIPCNISSLLKIRNNKLEWLQIIRSNDLFLGLPYNLVQFTTLQEVIAGWLEIDCGSYNQVSDSLHLYQKHYSCLDSIPFEKKKILNNDTISLPYKISQHNFKLLSTLIENIVYKKLDSKMLVRFLETRFDNISFKNFACIILAEHFRRRKNIETSKEMSTICTNPMLSYLWNRWQERFKHESGPK